MAETSLKKQIMSGMVWKFAERFIAQGVSFVVSLVLARILMPSDYGIIAIINVFITIADVLLTSGLNTALIQKQDVDELIFPRYFTATLSLEWDFMRSFSWRLRFLPRHIRCRY